MFRYFINLQWKSFFRSASLGKGLALKVLMVFFALYMMVSLILAGSGLFFLLQKIFPGTDPLHKLSEFMPYWLITELFIRYFMQKLPVMEVKPFLALPIKKSAIVHYILGRSGISFYNFMGLFIFVPFAIVLLTQGYPLLNVGFWLLAIAFLVLMVNYVNFIINKSDKAFLILAGLLIAFYALEQFTILPITDYAGTIFYALYEYEFLFTVPLFLSFLAYFFNYAYLRKRIFLDDSLGKRTKTAATSDLAWTKHFGSIAPFLQLDLRMIWRNKRTKTQVFISLAMILYGLVFYTMGDFALTSSMMVFVGIFITGIFLTNFGQFVPAWDSAYYSMLMSQNIPLRKYLDSKAGLISVSVVVMFLLSIPYVYFGWQALAINFSAALYNLGINIPMILLFGSLNKKRIDLKKSAFSNMQGTGAAQFLVIIPLLGLPILIFTLLKFLVSFEAGLLALAVLGLLGFFLRNRLLDGITELYRKKKYGMIAGFKQQNS
ncbi:DUF5687 family protein [Ulvibacterium sp.]|uniref:DUF5687 family protein n=1 Tax=Ulvibacterium sp. TaxID=2665914 RepID=UPI0026143E8B|nr:DUF5687 family protein [Ulvibacterium sp.]